MAPAKKRTQEEEEEEVLDPTLAEHPDATEEELHPPKSKKQRKDTAADGGGHDYSDLPKSMPQYGKGNNEMNPRKKTDQTPLEDLRDKLASQKIKKPAEGAQRSNVLFWMRNRDLRIEDNRALAEASASPGREHLIALHVLSPDEFKAHDRSPRRIDFNLRNLRIIEKQLAKLNIPLVVLLHDGSRTKVADKVVELAQEWGCGSIYGNLEYEVDELWRDAKVVDLASKNGIHVSFLDDAYVVPPGKVKTKQDKPYSVFTPFSRSWVDYLSKNMDLLQEYPVPDANDDAIHKDKTLGSLFKPDAKKAYGIPKAVPGFECEDAEHMAHLWPAGHKAAVRVLHNFINGKGGVKSLDGPATADDLEEVGAKAKNSRLNTYVTGRNLVGELGTSHVSPYLAAGIISARECLRKSKEVTNNRLAVGRDSGPAMWGTELVFRDFYAHVLAAWPRICMGRAFILKYENVVWETDEKTLTAWKEGKTGYPIVDAAQRQCLKQGYCHNRTRMITAMFLTKYFRIFNPISQSEKSDPEGDYIRHWVPELRNVKGKAIHDPFNRLDKAAFKKLGYPAPVVDHSFARNRALQRFKTPGEK
ncbi:DNA photolyase phr1 [Tilletia horrida]|uniref:DNA photolyase phr1 n=1 Tax=Tilletia horrida TaxID=155126 RepID=A0AAN6JPW9_9BASI|nr:DNA photolyase phr1 [Tilletia horrida]